MRTPSVITLHRRCLSVLLVLACDSRSRAGAWEVSIRGYGPIQAGMTLAEAGRAAGRPLAAPPAGSESCAMVGFAGDRSSGVRFMVIEGRVERVDIKDPAIRTNHGVAIGDPEERIPRVYPERVTVEPHKYTQGHYLVVGPRTPADSGFALVFETGGGRVTTYRAGRRPAVDYVEGCA